MTIPIMTKHTEAYNYRLGNKQPKKDNSKEDCNYAENGEMRKPTCQLLFDCNQCFIPKEDKPCR